MEISTISVIMTVVIKVNVPLRLRSMSVGQIACTQEASSWEGSKYFVTDNKVMVAYIANHVWKMVVGRLAGRRAEGTIDRLGSSPLMEW